MLLLEDKLAKIRNSLRIPCEFGCNDEDDCEEGYIFDILWDYINLNLYDVFRGVSKVAILTKDSSYVLKIPFNGTYFSKRDYESGDDYEEFEPFNHANNQINSWDYCETEAEAYELAEAKGLGKFFARTKRFGETKNGYPVYVQEKVIPSSQIEEDNEIPLDILKYVRRIRNDIFWKLGCDSYWIANAIIVYGLEEVFKLCEFAEEHPQFFSDMHDANYGYRLNGEPVILDYSNWND